MHPISRLFFALLALPILFLATPWPTWASQGPGGEDFQVSDDPMSDPFSEAVAVRGDGAFVVAWEAIETDGDGVAIAARFFDSEGVAGAPFVVNTTTALDQKDPDVALLADGSFVIVWDSEGSNGSRDVFAQRIDATGQKVGGELAISSSPMDDHNDAVVAAASDGGFLVVWEIDGAAPADEDLWGRRFDSAGTPLDARFPINIFTLSDQEDADVASDGDGNFVVVWESLGQDGSGDGLYLRLLDPTGQPVGGELAINQMTEGTQKNPFLGVRSDGVFAVVWNDAATNPEDDRVWMRLFDPDGTPRTSDIAVATQVISEDRARVGFGSLGQATVIFEGDDSMTGNLNVWYRTFDDTGMAASPEAVLTSISNGSQYAADLDFAPNGHGIATWLSSHVGPWQIFARRFPVVVFCDGFESGGTGAWSAASP